MMRSLTTTAVLSASTLALAGPLTPPPGAPAPTNKTLQEVEPRIPIGPGTTPGDTDSVYRIDAPGSYYLTGNLFAQANKSGIEVATSGVTIDLNGFALLGLVFPTGSSLDGITNDGQLTDVSIRNGSIRAWGRAGIDLFLVSGILIENVNASFNTTVGFFVPSGRVIACNAEANGSQGYIGSGVLSRSLATDNGGDGIVWSGSVQGCYSTSNAGNGFDVNDATVEGCVARVNTQSGFETANAIVRACVSEANDLHGFNAGFNSTLINNAAFDNDIEGYRVFGVDCQLDANRAQDNRGFGYVVTASNGLLIRNTSHGHAVEFSIPAGVSHGGILDVSSGGAFTTSNPWTNLQF